MMRYLEEMTDEDLARVENELVKYFDEMKDRPEEIDPDYITIHGEVLEELDRRQPEIMQCFRANGQYASLLDYLNNAPEITCC